MGCHQGGEHNACQPETAERRSRLGLRRLVGGLAGPDPATDPTSISSDSRPEHRRGAGSATGARRSPRRSDRSPRTVLFLTADTGGGHRAATEALSQALRSRYPDRFVAVSCDPLTGDVSHPLLRRVCGWYGPVTREAPWLWSVLFHLTNTPLLVGVLRRALRRLVAAPITSSLVEHRPAVVVATHPLVVDAAVAARRRGEQRPPLVTVVTDLATAHRSWWNAQVDRTITPSARLLEAGRRAGAAGLHDRPLGIPVREQFGRRQPVRGAERAALRTSLGLRPDGFLVLVTAGGEGGRGLKNWTRALVERLPRVDVVAICGRNRALRSVLDDLARATGDRLRVQGLVDDMSDWICCADLVISKAGPSIIAEATSVGVPLLLPTHIPGQEAGNAELAVSAGAARRVRGRRQLVREVDALRHDVVAMAEMRSAAVRFGRPQAAVRMAELVAEAAGAHEHTAEFLPPYPTSITRPRRAVR